MKRTSAMIAVVLMALFACGCADKYESAAREQLASIKAVNGVLAGITDEESMRKAQPELEQLRERMVACAKRAKAIEKPAPQRRLELEKTYRPQIEKEMSALIANMMRISRIKGGEELNKVFRDIENP